MLTFPRGSTTSRKQARGFWICIEKGWSVDAIAREVFGGPMLIEFITRGHFSRRNLVLSYLKILNAEEVPK